MVRPRPVDLVVLGPPKSGSSTLFATLAAHPRVDPCHAKEPVYFSVDDGLDRGVADGPDRSGAHDRGLGWYESLFGGPDDAVRLDGSTAYFASASAPQLLATEAPGAVGVVCLRDPVDRIVSHHWHERRASPLPDLDTIAEDGHPRLDHWVRCSRYGARLTRWLEHVAPAQLVVVGFERLRTEPGTVAGEVLAAVGLDPADLPAADSLDADTLNASGTARSRRLQRALTTSRLRRVAERSPAWLQRPLRAAARAVASANIDRAPYPEPTPEVVARLRSLVADDREPLEALVKEHWPTVAEEVAAWPR